MKIDFSLCLFGRKIMIISTRFSFKNLNPLRKKYEYEVGLVLSGGSARGYAHIGVLKAFYEHGIEPQILSGTSMGAIVGILYAAGYLPAEIEEILTKETFSKVTGFSWKRTGLLKMEKLKGVLERYIPEDNFSELKKPFYLGLTNLNRATKEFRHEGPIYDYLTASCSVPGMFSPVYIGEEAFVDGGLLCNLPASAIRDKCRILIGSHVNFPGEKQDLSGPKGIMERSVNLGITQNSKPEMELCDYLIDPPEMQNFSLLDFSKIQDIIKVGYDYTSKMIAAGDLPVSKLVTYE